MVTHRRIAVVIISFLVLPLALIAACDKVPLLAPTGTVITLLPATNTVSLNSEINIVATVIENGTAVGGTGPTVARSSGGTPVQNGTLISFTTTLGRIEPSEARTHNGQVTVKLITAGASGTATITAFSGGASSTKDLTVGTAAAKGLVVTTTPQSLSASGGNVQVSATVLDAGGNPLSGIPVTFATDKGSVSPSTVTSDASGVAAATLTTNTTAKVTATAGTATGSATVTVNARALASFSADPAATSVGVPVKFTVTPNAGANLSNVRVDFGDGSSTNLGPIIAGGGTTPTATTTSHVYSSPGNYTASATGTDTSGEVAALSTSVVVGSLSVSLTASDTTPDVGESVTFTTTGLGTAQVDHFTFTFSDGTAPVTTSSPSQPHIFTTRGAHSARVDVFGVGGGLLASATAGVNVQ
jgi:adhesin/invasin